MAFSVDLMTADAIAQMQGDFEPQRSNNGVLEIEGLGTVELLTLSIDTFPLPTQQNGIVEIPYLNETRKVAGRVTVDDMDVVYKDWVDKETAKILWEWRLQVYNPVTGQVGLARNYKKRGLITLFAPDASFQREWEVFGIWPANMNPGEIDMAGEEQLKITMSLTIDKANFVKSSASTAAA